MKKLFAEFKAFISKGNVIDLAVGMIIGSAFTAIVSALVNNILKPLINWIPGADGTGALQLVLRPAVVDAEGKIVTDALIMDFGAVISAVITFLLTALILFAIVKAIATAQKKQAALRDKMKKEREDKLRAEGKLPPLAENAEVPAEVKPTTEELLEQIRDLLAAQNRPQQAAAADAEPQANEEDEE